MTNYISLGKCGFGAWERYLYLDTDEFLARSLIRRHMIRVKVENILVREKEKYRLVELKVLKKDEPLFLRAMEELKGKMLLFGHLDYESHGGGLMDITRDMIRKEVAETGRLELPTGQVVRVEQVA